MLLMCMAMIPDSDHRSDFERMYYACRGGMFAYARRILDGDAGLAEDAVQCAFIDAARNMHRLTGLTDIQQKIYLLKAVRSWCFKTIAKEKKQRGVVEQLQDAELIRQTDGGLERILEQLCARESFNEIVAEIRALPEKYKEVLYLYYVDGESMEHIAAHLGEKYNTVKTRYRRGTGMLIQRLKERGIGQ